MENKSRSVYGWISIICLVLVSCSGNPHDDDNSSRQGYKNYDLIRIDTSDHETVRVDALTQRKLMKYEIRESAKRIWSDMGSEAVKMSIDYFVVVDSGDELYARAHFDPELNVDLINHEISILKPSPKDIQQPGEKIIGVWVDYADEGAIIIFSKNGRYFKDFLIDGERGGTSELVKVTKRNKSGFQFKSNLHDEFFYITENGNLRFYDSYGFIVESPKLY